MRLMLDPTSKPTPRLRARVVGEQLEDRRQRLQDLKRWIKKSAGAGNHERVHADAAAVATEHLRQAVDARELASRD